MKVRLGRKKKINLYFLSNFDLACDIQWEMILLMLFVLYNYILYQKKELKKVKKKDILIRNGT